MARCTRRGPRSVSIVLSGRTDVSAGIWLVGDPIEGLEVESENVIVDGFAVVDPTDVDGGSGGPSDTVSDNEIDKLESAVEPGAKDSDATILLLPHGATKVTLMQWILYCLPEIL